MHTHDDNTFRRYLLGTATSQEREDIERQLLSDDEIAARLMAFDDEMMIDAARNRLTAAEQRAFETAVQASPARIQRLAETRALVDGIAELVGDEDVLAAVSDVGRNVVPRMAFAFGVLAVVLSALGWQLWRLVNRGPARAGGASAASEARPIDSHKPSVVAVLTLASRIERDSTMSPAPANALSLSARTTAVRLVANADVRTNDISLARAEIRRQGGAMVPIVEAADVRLGPHSVNVQWAFAASQIDIGAHRLIVTGETAGGASETLFEWFFTVVRSPSAGPEPADGGRAR